MPAAVTSSHTTKAALKERRHILYVDAYDSFSNSIVGLLEQSLGASVTTVRIDDESAFDNFTTILKAFDAVVVGPGPGHPANPSDVGLIDQLWKLSSEDLLPVFGICLGFQSLCLAYGADIKRLKQARHGIISNILHNRTDIFRNIAKLRATQYHSLHAVLDNSSNDCAEPQWQTNDQSPHIQPLAWDVEDEINGIILMAARHTEKPFWGVQFHPESICTSREGITLMRRWWVQAEEWLTYRSRTVVHDRMTALDYISPAAITVAVRDRIKHKLKDQHHSAGLSLAKAIQLNTGAQTTQLQWASYATDQISPIKLAEALDLDREESILLDSQNHSMGRFSMLGVVVPGETMKITYRSWDRTLRYGTGPDDEQLVQLSSIDQTWPIFQEALDIHDPNKQRYERNLDRRNEDLPHDSPFWGGLMGYISYEAGLETIDVAPHESLAHSIIPDINFAFIHRSIVIDHVKGYTYVQSLLPNDSSWTAHVGRTIEVLAQQQEPTSEPRTARGNTSITRELREGLEMEKRLSLSQIRTPQERYYRNKVLRCQDSLAAGDSYELCLTDETLIKVPKIDGKGVNAWALYKKLRLKNPAPYGAYLHLSNATVVGTSPERFLKWDREGNCQFRPIKGTVKKSPTMTREAAHNILKSSKEQAENLMIVDLIRHDLSGVIGAERCSVPKLMTVEEYEHVYQLVSVIEGQLPESATGEGPTGLDVLKASLPPGSMTGAPKKRSCEILRDIEQRPRGIYSGVLGYLDVGGAGDFSVVIRTALHDATTADRSTRLHTTVDDSGNSTPHSHVGYTPSNTSPRCSSPSASVREGECSAHESTETWRIGAGGAVTIQSTDEGEFLEMETKVMTALTAFQSK
ncbi:para-aminobenzoate synthase, (PABA) [Didymosphaeria variabile]|uniref:aminodeoxychorismate synthase n=1 Tax=Didymosphaeria variabile TaxID=1932322 RepID=A0A9W8XGF4_9PLEO|nr:para-aminobenzoate synthase, (PABA) [Didymosphaeria variabile]KAJ4350186.1 para-aminobenzoate synthase, (PABA) [Didymosphaeria variabile]